MINRLRKIIWQYTDSYHMREVARGALVALFLKIIGAGLAFGFNVAVARILGAEDVGLYFLALSITTICSVIGRVGLDNSLLRFIATHATKEEWGNVKGVYALGMRIAILASGTITIIVFSSAPLVANIVFNKPELAEPLRWMCLSILPFSMLNLHAESLKGIKRIRDAMLAQGVGLPLVSLLLIGVFFKNSGVSGIAISYALSSVIIFILSVVAWKLAELSHKEKRTKFSFVTLWLSCKPLFIASIMNRAILPWAPLFMLGIWSSNEDVGIYGVASRVVMLVSLMLITINNVIAPKFAELYAKRDMLALEMMSSRLTLLLTILATPIFLVFIFQGRWIMVLFGNEFEQGALVLLILSIGQIINVMTGAVVFVLLMSGNERTFQKISMWSTLIMLIISIIAIPLWGSVGAAFAVAVTLIINNFAAVWAVYTKLNIIPIPFLRRFIKR